MLRYIVWGLIKALLLILGPTLLIVGSIIGAKFGWWLLKRKLKQLDKALPQ